MPHQLVKRVQVAPGPFHALQGFGHLADSLDSRVVDSVGVPFVVLVPPGHDGLITPGDTKVNDPFCEFSASIVH